MTLAIVTAPILMLSLQGSLSALFFVLVIISGLYLYRTRSESSAVEARPYVFYLAMVSPLLATVISQTYHGSYKLSDWDSPARFMLAIPVYLALRKADLRVVAPLQYGVALGAVVALITALLNPNPHVDIFGPRLSNYFMNPIHFGDLVLMLGMLSICSINWTKTDSPGVLALKVIGLLAGGYASFLSGTRTGWLALLILVVVWLWIAGKNSRKKLALGSAVMVGTLALAYWAIPAIQQRVDFSASEITWLLHGNFESSAGLRLQIWKAATLTFIDNPVFGVGTDGFDAALKAMAAAGTISAEAARTGVLEVHSQIFASGARLGMLGLLSYALLHFVPLRMFYAAMKSPVPATRKSGLMGMCLVAGFLVFGLTVEMYNLKMVATFYAMTLAILLAATATRGTATPAANFVAGRP